MPTEHAADRARDVPAYTVSSPQGADADKAYPVVLLLPPGPQTAEMAASMSEFLAATATAAGWVVIVPRPSLSAAGGPLLFESASRELTGLVKHLDTWLKCEGGKFYVLGASNGGVSAVRFGLDFPERTAALIAFPGAMPPGLPTSAVAKLKGFPLRFWVGGNDSKQWLDAAKFMSDSINRFKLDGKVTTVQGEGHMVRSLTAEKIMNELNAIRTANRGEATLTDEQRAVLARLDELHDAAASALAVGPAAFERYFASFDPQGVFIGTDATERSTVDQFKDYARPLFAAKKGWKYTPRPGSRHVQLSDDGRTAWFDELLDNSKYGLCRGTGVLARASGKAGGADGPWLIMQYHLTMPVPNELAEKVSKMIKAK